MLTIFQPSVCATYETMDYNDVHDRVCNERIELRYLKKYFETLTAGISDAPRNICQNIFVEACNPMSLIDFRT